jgi:UDPglucose 6-dehydrogenase
MFTGPTSAVTAYKSDVEVTVVDINPDRISAWKSNSLPIYEPGLHDIVKVARDGIRSNDDRPTTDYVAREGKTCFIETNNAKGWLRQPKLFFSTDVDSAIKDADLIFVCVNTPTKANGIGKGAAADLGYVEAATRNIAKVAMEDKIVVEKSTVPCRTAQSIREIVSLQHTPNPQMMLVFLTQV